MISRDFLKFTLRSKEFIFSKYWMLPILGLILFFIFFGNELQSLKLEAASIVLGSIFGFSYFIQKQKLDEINFFRDAFIDFNEKYEKIAPSLAEILESKSIDNKNRSKLIEYFNLCAEEYLLYKRGYIPTEIWKSWLNGMKQYWEVKEIRIEWERELKTNSYYGFKPYEEIKSNFESTNFIEKKVA